MIAGEADQDPKPWIGVRRQRGGKYKKSGVYEEREVLSQLGKAIMCGADPGLLCGFHGMDNTNEIRLSCL
jgi:hypothetical protein